MSSETVKPIPDRAPPAQTCPEPTPCGRVPRPNLVAPSAPTPIPTSLPTTRPTTTPHVTVEVSASPSSPPRRSTPALASAKRGTMT